MKSTSPPASQEIPSHANFTASGSGAPVILVHGLAASLHDWDALVPELVRAGYSAYALDLLGHGDSPKPQVPLYQMTWMLDHFLSWLQGLDLPSAPVLIGHSLGGYLALEYARRFPDRVRGLVLVDPFYANGQLPAFLRWAYGHPRLTSILIGHTPEWLLRAGIYVMSVTMGHRASGLHGLSKTVRDQTALDYMRTAPAAYGILEKYPDLSPYLASISAPTLVVWGERDHTLAPASFSGLVELLPKAVGRSRATGHVPHQAEADWFGAEVLRFLGSLPPLRSAVSHSVDIESRPTRRSNP